MHERTEPVLKQSETFCGNNLAVHLDRNVVFRLKFEALLDDLRRQLMALAPCSMACTPRGPASKHSRVNSVPWETRFSLAETLVQNGTTGGMGPRAEWHRQPVLVSVKMQPASAGHGARRHATLKSEPQLEIAHSQF